MTVSVVLASASPRRRELLGRLGVEFEVRAADVDEAVRPGEPPETYVERLAREKALAVARPGELVVGADTTVDLDGQILGKPESAAEARSMLRELSARTHRVHSGVAVVRDGRVESAVDTTLVTMAVLDEHAIEWYVATGEPFDKAGAYALQAAGGIFVTSVTGSVSNVVGMSLPVVVSLAQRQNFDIFRSSSRPSGDG